MQAAKDQIQGNEQPQGAVHEALPDVTQDVMSELVAGDEERFAIAGLLQRGIPDNHAFGSPEPGYVGVDLIALFTGAHQENAIPGYRDSGVARQLLNSVHQLGMFLVERFEFVEQRIDDQRIDKNNPQEDGQSGKPEVQPPAPRASPNDGKQNQDEDEREKRAHQFFLGPIPKPRTPALHGLFVTQRQRMPIQAHRQIENVRGQDQQGHEDKGLQPATAGGAFGKIAESGGHAQLQEQEEHHEAHEIGDKIKRVGRPRVGHRFLVAILG